MKLKLTLGIAQNIAQVVCCILWLADGYDMAGNVVKFIGVMSGFFGLLFIFTPDKIQRKIARDCVTPAVVSHLCDIIVIILLVLWAHWWVATAYLIGALSMVRMDHLRREERSNPSRETAKPTASHRRFLL